MNTFKSFVKNIAEKADDIRSPTKESITQEDQGFICPVCMDKFKDGEALQIHFVNSHNDSFETHSEVQNGVKISNSENRTDKSDLDKEIKRLKQRNENLEHLLTNEESTAKKASELAVENANLKARLDLVLENNLVLADDLAKLKKIGVDSNQSFIEENESGHSEIYDKTKNVELQIEVETMKAQLSRVTEELDSKTKHLSDIEKMKLNENAARIKESNKILHLNAELETSRCEFVRERNEKSDISMKFKKEQKRNESISKELQEIKLKCSEYLAEMKMKEDLVLAMKRDQEELRNKIQEGEGTNVTIVQLRQENDTLTEALKTESAKLSLIESNLKQDLNAAKEEYSSMEDEFTNKLQEYEKTNLNLKTEYEKIFREKKNLIFQLEEQTNQLNLLEKEISQKDEKIESDLKSYNEINTNLENCKKSLVIKSQELQKKEVEYNELRTRHESELKTIKEKNNILEEEVSNLKTNYETYKIEINSLSKLSEDLKALNISLKTDINKLKTEANTLNKENSDQILFNQKLNKKLEESELRLFQAKESYEKKSIINSEALAKLKLSHESKINEIAIIKEENTSLEKDKKELQKYIKELDITLENLNTEKNTLSNNIVALKDSNETDLKEIQAKHVAVLESFSSKLERLEEKNKDIALELEIEKESTNEKESLIKEYKLSLASTNDKCKELDAEKSDLESQIKSFNDERRGILERCVAAENDLEKSKSDSSTLRRKLDDSQAALHELGRENQLVRLELNKIVGRKWTNDSDVTECSVCKSSFSFTIRKHHCRNCCDIFCGDCSSKSFPFPNQKKPQRVCDACYEELMVK